MLTSAIVRLIEFCVRHARVVVLACLLVTLAAGDYAAVHFKMTSDMNALLSDKLPWRRREQDFEQAFHRFKLIYAVVNAPTPELASMATRELARRLTQDKTHFLSVSNVAGAPFFAREGLLFLAKDKLKTFLHGMAEGQPLIQDLYDDQSLRGLVAGLEDALIGVNDKRLRLDVLAPPLDAAAATVEAVLAGQPASFSWRVVAQGHAATPDQLRGIVVTRPKLDYDNVEPGRAASDALRAEAAAAFARDQARVRLTGPVAMSDEEFGTIKEHALRNGLITVALVLFILWRALRSSRLILAVVVNLVAGLAITAALGLAMVGAFNLISVYFAVLFVGIGVDFGIQFSVRYRAERHVIDDLDVAVARAGRRFGAPLTLAGLATAAGFLSFAPTDYRGVSELGLIAGVGMLVAYAASVTLLPALIVLLRPPREPEPLGYAALAPLDAFLARRRKPVLIATALVVVAGLPLFHWLKFDFNPIDLQNSRTEAVATYLELARDPSAGVNAIEALAPSLGQADRLAARLRQLPVVAGARTLSDFIPPDQPEKLALIAATAKKLAPSWAPSDDAPPTDADNVAALREAAERLEEAAKDAMNGSQKTGVAAAQRLAGDLSRLADAAPALRARAQDAFVRPLAFDLDGLRLSLGATPITRASLPPDLTRQWIAADGRARLSIEPRQANGDNRRHAGFRARRAEGRAAGDGRACLHP